MVLYLIIVAAASIVNRQVETSLYSVIALYVVVKVADFIVEGLNYAKTFHIITDYPQEISEEIIKKLDRGITGLKGKGMYPGKDKMHYFA